MAARPAHHAEEGFVWKYGELVYTRIQTIYYDKEGFFGNYWLAVFNAIHTKLIKKSNGMSRRKHLSLFYRGIYILLAGITLLMGLGTNGNYLLVYYTTQSNILCFLFFLFYFIHGLLKKGTTKPGDLILRLKGAITLCIAVTGIVFTVLSGPEYVSLQSSILHYICPVMVFLDYLFFDEKGKYKPQDPFLWLIIPALYVVFALVRGFLGGEIGDTGGNFPYPFLDPTSTGMGVYMSALYVGVMLIVFLTLGYIIFAIDKILVKKYNDNWSST